MFEGRLPRHLQDRAPKVVEDQDGHEAWEFAGERFHLIGQNAVAGRRPETVKIEPLRFADMRKGCWDIDARVHDMDIGGVWASMSFPSMITGFCGRVYSRCPDQELGRAVTLAWNDWLFEEWYSPYPERIIPMGITYLANPEWGAEEIRRNAARGFCSVTLPERPHLIGLPSIFSEYWEPMHPRLRGDRDGDQPARRLVGKRRDTRRCSHSGAGRVPLRSAVHDRGSRVAVGRLGPSLPRA